MRNFRVIMLLVVSILLSSVAHQAIAQLTVAGLKWDEKYTFDKSNSFKVEFYAKGNELMRTLMYKTHFQSEGQNFSVRLLAEGKGQGMETVMDLKNNVAIQIMGAGGESEAFYNVGGFRLPADAELKKLELVATEEIKSILGRACRKYTYTYKKIFGEVWLTEEVAFSNDWGIFRAAKMAALHNTLSVGGFVMEMTSEDSRGGKTIMTTTQLNQPEIYEVSLSKVKMNTAINKVNYYSF